CTLTKVNDFNDFGTVNGVGHTDTEIDVGENFRENRVRNGTIEVNRVGGAAVGNLSGDAQRCAVVDGVIVQNALGRATGVLDVIEIATDHRQRACFVVLIGDADDFIDVWKLVTFGVNLPVVRIARHRHLRIATQNGGRQPREEQRTLKVVEVVVGVVGRTGQHLVEQTYPVFNRSVCLNQRL